MSDIKVLDPGTPPEFSIHLVSTDLGMPLLGSPNHNYISVRDLRGEEIFAIHGLAIDRETGGVVAVGDNDDTLRAVITTPEFFDIHDTYEKDSEHVLFTGSEEDVLRRVLPAFDATAFINNQNLIYDKIEVAGTAQNSNSVAHTMVEAMGFDFPEEIERYWAPGHDRILLPEDWSSPFADPSMSEDQVFLSFYYFGDVVGPGEILRQAIEDPVPPADREKFFDRAEPFVPYSPALEQPDAGQTSPDAENETSVEIVPTPASAQP